MNISEASRLSGLPSKTIRYYEEIDIVKPDRAQNGYRVYSERDVHQLTFVQRARSLGFTIEECKMLLSLYSDDKRASADVKRLALKKVEDIDLKIKELKSLKKILSSLASNCHGDGKPDCPIIDELSGNKNF